MASSHGIQILDNERNRQIEKGFDLAHDKRHGPDLLRAAACYLDWAAGEVEGSNDPNDPGPHPFWPWPAGEWKPEDARSALVKAGAMIGAYIDAEDLYVFEDSAAE